jgi:hypothetical protein
MMLIRDEYARQGERDGYLVVSPLGDVRVALSIAHQTGRIDDPLVEAFVQAARVPWPDMKPRWSGDARR